MPYDIPAADAMDAETTDLLRPGSRQHALDDLATMATQMLSAQAAAILAIDGTEWGRSGQGARGAGPHAPVRAMRRSIAEHAPVLHLADVRADSRFQDDPQVARVDGLRCYLGVAINAPDGRQLGVLGVADIRPRDDLGEPSLDVLRRLARIAGRLLSENLPANAARHVPVQQPGAGMVGQSAVEDALAHWLDDMVAPGAADTPAPARTAPTSRTARATRGDKSSARDQLTGLPERGALLTTLDELLSGGTRPLAVALLGLDNFRALNDTLGHLVGDTVLQVVALRLQAVLPADTTLARFGGDEFALVYAAVPADSIDTHLRAVLRDLSRPCQVNQHQVHIEASIGLAVCDSREAGVDNTELIARADLAMQRAKQGGGNQLRHYQPHMRAQAIDRRRLDLELRRASDEGEFELHYQPQVCLATGRPTGAEALLRWRHPVRGLLGPDQFIDALAHSSVGPTVGRWILEQACRDASGWPRIDGRPLAVGVNLFPVQLDNGCLLGEVDHALASSGLLPAHLELELTETIALRDDGIAAAALAGLRTRGIRVAYDDFGTGYASLSVLRRLPVDRLKIDRSFVRDVLANRGDAAIVRSILLIARNFDLRVIAEGVETEEQAQLLRELGCQEAQGFLYARALPPAEFGQWIAARTGSVPLQQMAVAGHA